MKERQTTRSNPEQAAERLLAEYGIVKPSVSIERLARQIGAQLIYEPFDGEVSGMLVQEAIDGPPIIVVNSRTSKVRQRFTIAHKTGHLLLHNRKIYVDQPFAVKYSDSQSSLAIDPKEIQANQFGASVLMPRDGVIKDVDDLLARERGISGDQLIQVFADRYQVSRQAMEYRLAHLGIWAPL
ncbi:MAG: hypothetical protein QOJ59_2511 [Thermomicrobiales bacterium]|jgi:Zn-dependent peptidase ImmA (M78 family)|nr:hypothetical protein [Thermomicrobiales bacterium]